MNNRLLKIPGAAKARPATVRRHVATVLMRRILDNPAVKDFPSESEHQLWRQSLTQGQTNFLNLGFLRSKPSKNGPHPNDPKN